MRTGFYEDYAIINLRQPGCSYTMRENSNSENELFELTAVGIKGKHQLLSQEVQGGKVRDVCHRCHYYYEARVFGERSKPGGEDDQILMV